MRKRKGFGGFDGPGGPRAPRGGRPPIDTFTRHIRNELIFDVADIILTSINRAADSGDFTGLGKDIGNVVKDATDNISGTVKSAIQGDKYTPFFSKKINKNDGIAMLIIGVVCSFFGLFIVGIPLIILGIRTRHIVDSYMQYGRIIGDREYITISELSAKTAQKEKRVLKNLTRMMKKGYLPNAAIDSENTTLMLTDSVYQQYSNMHTLDAEATVKEDTVEPSEAPKTKEDLRQYYTIDDSLPDNVKEILKDGNVYLNKIRYYNDLIPDDEEMSDKLYTMEATVLSIFKKLKEQPDVAGDLRKLMSYYLPTTEKLLQSYVDLRDHPGSLDNIKSSQKEIEDATDVINEAFAKLLNQLFQSDAWDISSDISVMKTMMKQDSLI